jgi:VWFA-related protein
MRTRHRICLALVFSLPSLICAQQRNAPVSPATQTGTVSRPEAKVRVSPLDEAVELEGLIRLDVVVTDGADNAVPGLKRTDFTLLDNGQPQKIVAFRAFSAGSAKPDPPVSVILLIDTLNLPGNIAAFEHGQVTEFLRQNAGHLAQPVTIYSLDNRGFFLNAKPSLDGNALADDVDSDRKLHVLFAAPRGLPPFRQALVDPAYSTCPALTALRAIGTIATAEDRNPGRKLLLWVGPGLRGGLTTDTGTGQYPDRFYDHYDPKTGLVSYNLTDQTSPKEKLDRFGKIYWFSTLLRQARISLDSFSVDENDRGLTHINNPAQKTPATGMFSSPMLITNAWQAFMVGVPAIQQASMMDLYKKVLAVQSGGRVLPREKDLAQQIASCVADIDTFYTLTFDPPLAAHADEYHTLKVELSQAGLTARTTTGYYDEPFYSDRPDPGLRRVTVAQLEQIIHAAHGNGDATRLLSPLELTERLSGAKLAALTAELHGGKARGALEEIADQSAFLAPPPSEIPADLPPDRAAQQQILASAADYLDHIIPKLANFFASRTAIRFGETAAYHELSTMIDPVPLHVEEKSKATVLYLHGAEIVDAARWQNSPPEGRSLSSHGTFGPLLRVIRGAMDLSGSLTWSRWEQSAGGRRAVFRFQVTAAESRGGVFRKDDETTRFEISPAYHGEIAIDPASGAILRVHVQHDLQGFVPADRADMMVAYGSVEIGGRTYILPVRSVSIWRGRAAVSLEEWNESFQTWGPYETQVNDFTFDHYHMSRGEARMLPGFTGVP